MENSITSSVTGPKKIKKDDPISKSEYIKCYSPKDKTGNEGQIKNALEIALEIALDTRKFEIELYWKRTAYFVLFIGVIFVGYYNVLSKSHWLSLFIAALGFLLSLLWYMANRGSKFWQENWEAQIEELSTYLGTPIFGIIKRRKDSIYNPIGHYPFSVSKVNQMVSLIITSSWFLTFIKDALIFNEKDKQYIKDFIANCSILDAIFIFLQDNIWRTIIGVFIIIILSLLVIYLCKGFAAKIPNKEADKSPNKEDSINYFWHYSSELYLNNDDDTNISNNDTTNQKEATS